MAFFFKFLLSLVLPVTVLILVPVYLEGQFSIPFLPTFLFGLVFVGIGLTIMVLTIRSFARIGKGTLAPWSPTKKLVITGLYRYVRNPMILGVLTVLAGEAIAVSSWRLTLWAAIFFGINTVYFILYEEPDLERKFGDEYREYKKHVPRWIPRSQPYQPGNETRDSIYK